MVGVEALNVLEKVSPGVLAGGVALLMGPLVP